jgi:hypothetical protein
MDFEDLQQRWHAVDRKLDASIRLNARVVRELSLGKVSSALGRLSRALVIELLINAAGLAWLGNYVADHLRQPRFAGPAAVLALVALAWVVWGGRQLATVARVDYGVPVLGIQQQLEQLAVARLWATRWTLLLGPLLWTPLLIVGLEALFGVDAWIRPGVPFLVANLLFGLLAIPLLMGLGRALARRVGRSPRLQRLLGDLGGHNLAVARRALATLAAFESDPLSA